MGTQRLDFAEFYRESKDACLFSVLVNVGDRDVAQDLVDEAFAGPGHHGGRSAGIRHQRRGWSAPRSCPSNGWGPLTRVMSAGFHNPTQDAVLIHPSALPSGAGLQIWTKGTPGAADNFQLHVRLVQASLQCTGS